VKTGGIISDRSEGLSGKRETRPEWRVLSGGGSLRIQSSKKRNTNIAQNKVYENGSQEADEKKGFIKGATLKRSSNRRYQGIKTLSRTDSTRKDWNISPKFDPSYGRASSKKSRGRGERMLGGGDYHHERNQARRETI